MTVWLDAVAGMAASQAAASGNAAPVAGADAVRQGPRAAAAGQLVGQQVKVPQTWDQYVATQLQAGPDKQRQASLIAVLKRELARPGNSTFAFKFSVGLHLDKSERGLCRGYPVSCSASDC